LSFRCALPTIIVILAPFQICGNVCAEERNGLPESVLKFCDAALASDRGVALTPLAGSFDEILLNLLLTDRAMQKTIGLNDEDVQRLQQRKRNIAGPSVKKSKEAKTSVPTK
jgi:hypothetical protein